MRGEDLECEDIVSKVLAYTNTLLHGIQDIAGLACMQVRGCMARAHDVLRASCCSMATDGAAKPSWAAVQTEGQDHCVAAASSSEFPLLDTIINTSLALDRSPSASQVCFCLNIHPLRHCCHLCSHLISMSRPRITSCHQCYDPVTRVQVQHQHHRLLLITISVILCRRG